MKEVNRGEMYYANLYPVKGSEQGGVRPVVIIQNDIDNKTSPTTIVAAIITKAKNRLPTHVDVSGCGLSSPSVVLLEQIRTIDKSRLTKYIGKLEDSDIELVDKAIVQSFGIRYLEELLHGE